MKKYKILVIIVLLFAIIVSLIRFPEIISSFIIIGIACLFLIYWVRLVFKYERDLTYKQDKIVCNEDELLSKYTPIMAGCIQANRNALFRDVVATILDLVNKKYLLMEISKTSDGKYRYLVKTNKESNYILDEVEEYILKWFSKTDIMKLEGIAKTTTSDSVPAFKEIDLLKRLKEMTKEKKFFDKMKRIDEKVMRKINKEGFNKHMMPIEVKKTNGLFLDFSILVFLISIFYVLAKGENRKILIVVVFMSLVLPYIMPIIYGIIYKCLLNPFSKTKNKLLKGIIKNDFSFRLVATIFVLIIICFITFITTKSVLLLANELLFGVSLLIVLTSNVSLKNDLSTIEDYSALNILKNKIETYSLLQDREIADIILWGKYLIYSISFGISIESKKQFQDSEITGIYKEMFDDREILKVLKYMR